MNASNPSSRQALSIAENYFKRENLDFPYVAKDDEEKFVKISEGIFGTVNPLPAHLYNIEAYLKEALSSDQDYVLFGMDKLSTLGMHYYTVKENVAIFIQLNADPRLENLQDRINGIFYGVSLILTSIKEAKENNLIPQDSRLIILDSDFYGKGWGWVNGLPGRIDKENWNEENPVLMSAYNDIPFPMDTK